jgi:hypothetical protein
MQKNIAPINSTTTQIDEIGNLQNAWQFLVERSLSGITPIAFRPLIAPNSPTRENLEAYLQVPKALLDCWFSLLCYAD